MANYSITDTEVAPLETVRPTVPYDGIAGEAIDAGEVCYVDTSDSNKLKLMDANVSVAAGTVWGVAICSAGTGQRMWMAVGKSQLTLATSAISGATVGNVIVVSETAGKMAPASDLASSTNLYYVGVFITTTAVELLLANPAIEKP